MQTIKIETLKDLEKISKGDWLIVKSKHNGKLVYQGVVIDVGTEKEVVAFSNDKEFCSNKNVIIFTLFKQAFDSPNCRDGSIRYVQSGRHVENYFSMYDFEYMKEMDAFFEFALYGNLSVMKALV